MRDIAHLACFLDRGEAWATRSFILTVLFDIRLVVFKYSLRQQEVKKMVQNINFAPKLSSFGHQLWATVLVPVYCYKMLQVAAKRATKLGRRRKEDWLVFNVIMWTSRRTVTCLNATPDGKLNMATWSWHEDGHDGHGDDDSKNLLGQPGAFRDWPPEDRHPGSYGLGVWQTTYLGLHEQQKALKPSIYAMQVYRF